MSRSLPTQPSLEHLKKQAKDLQAAFAAGEPSAVQRVRAHLPQRAGGSGEDPRQGHISLQEAQHVLAREYGFRSWNWLRAVVTVDFDLFGRLSRREIETALRQIDQKDLVISLRGASKAVQEAVLDSVSERVRAFLEEEMEFLAPETAAQAPEVQRRILLQLHRLAQDGRVTWPGGDDGPGGASARPAAGGRMDAPRWKRELLARRLMDLSVEEVAELWVGLAREARAEGILALEPALERIAEPLVAEGVQLAIDGTEPDLVEDILRTRIERVLVHQLDRSLRMLIEGTMALRAGDHPRIILHKLSAFYARRPDTEHDTASAPDLESLQRRLCAQPLAEMEPRSLALVFDDAAQLTRRRGIEALRPLVEQVEEPLLRRALEMLVDRVELGRIVEELEEGADEILRQAQARWAMCPVAVSMIQHGKAPEEIRAATLATAREILEGEEYRKSLAPGVR